MMPIGENNDAAYHPFLRRGPRCVPHLVQSVPVDKVPRTLWCLDTEFHKWPGHRFPFIALLLINLLKYAVTTRPCSTIVKTFTRIPILRWSIDTIGYMSQRLQFHTWNFYLLRNHHQHHHWKTAMNHMRALLRQPCSITLF